MCVRACVCVRAWTHSDVCIQRHFFLTTKNIFFNRYEQCASPNRRYSDFALIFTDCGKQLCCLLLLLRLDQPLPHHSLFCCCRCCLFLLSMSPLQVWLQGCGEQFASSCLHAVMHLPPAPSSRNSSTV